MGFMLLAQQLYRRYARFFNRIPMINQVRNKGNDNIFDLDKPIIRSKIVCLGNNNKIILMPGGGLDKCSFHISGDHNTIIIGKRSSAIHASLYIEDSNNSIEIGDDCSLCGEILLAACEGTSIKIGDEALCSSHIELRTSDSHAIYDTGGRRINAAKNINIGKHVWIATGVRINKGVVIGDNNVIGNAAVVTKTFTNTNVIIAGNPAKIIKEEIIWSKER